MAAVQHLVLFLLATTILASVAVPKNVSVPKNASVPKNVSAPHPRAVLAASKSKQSIPHELSHQTKRSIDDLSSIVDAPVSPDTSSSKVKDTAVKAVQGRSETTAASLKKAKSDASPAVERHSSLKSSTAAMASDKPSLEIGQGDIKKSSGTAVASTKNPNTIEKQKKSQAADTRSVNSATAAGDAGAKAAEAAAAASNTVVTTTTAAAATALRASAAKKPAPVHLVAGTAGPAPAAAAASAAAPSKKRYDFYNPPSKLASQGFQGEAVQHVDGKSSTADFGREFGPNTYGGLPVATASKRDKPDKADKPEPTKSSAIVSCSFATLPALLVVSLFRW
eukprot:gnl/TRDRNA2_/TRDRNA2_66854_c0_seq1.p1 gnl/TRDRNA2_/TRDRNA2_66854_c0~~gnl/TRDRNA2_/TRDRNA2_66854_c0_seq1.p1  ORF type:complete len:337 (+),score=78.89 gnl/TRDRNA2_/TRDRNA2_66854_c0_seq1:69-1079(+)